MATPRKHWFRVADSVRDEPWSNDVLAGFIRLSAHLNTRWARDGKSGDEAGRIALSAANVALISGKRRADVARTCLERLAEVVSMSVEHRGEVTLISWPKFVIFQRYESDPGAGVETDEPSAVPPPQDAPARRKTQEDVGARNAPAAPAASPPTDPPEARKSRRAPRGKTRAPDDLDPEQKRALLAWVRAKEPDAEPELRALVDACLDHFRASGGLKADWVATCRTWIRNRKRFAPRGEIKTFAERKHENTVSAVVGAVRLLGGAA